MDYCFSCFGLFSAETEAGGLPDHGDNADTYQHPRPPGGPSEAAEEANGWSPSVPNSAASQSAAAVSSLNANLLLPPALNARRYNRLPIHLFSILLSVGNAPPSPRPPPIFRKS